MTPPVSWTTTTTTATEQALEHTYGGRSVDPSSNDEAKLLGVRLAGDLRDLAWRDTRVHDQNFRVTCYYYASVEVDEGFLSRAGDASEIASPFAAAASKLFSVIIAPRRDQFLADKWMAQVRAWASSHPQRDRVIDDTRESIYGDRG